MNFPSDTPCIGCRKYRQGCHKECERYKAWKYQRSEKLAKPDGLTIPLIIAAIFTILFIAAVLIAESFIPEIWKILLGV